MSDSLRDRRIDGVLPGHVHFDRIGRRSDFRRSLPCTLDIDIGDRDHGTLAHIGLCESAANSPGRSGDQRTLAFETFHRIAIPFSSNLCRCCGSGVRKTWSPWVTAKSPPTRAVNVPMPSAFTCRNVSEPRCSATPTVPRQMP